MSLNEVLGGYFTYENDVEEVFKLYCSWGLLETLSFLRVDLLPLPLHPPSHILIF